MTYDEFVADAKAKAQAACDAIRAFFVAHPEVQSDAADLARAAADDLSTVATNEVNAVAPKSAQQILDNAIDAIRQKAEADATAVKADAQTHIAALEAAKSAVVTQ